MWTKKTLHTINNASSYPGEFKSLQADIRVTVRLISVDMYVLLLLRPAMLLCFMGTLERVVSVNSRLVSSVFTMSQLLLSLFLSPTVHIYTFLDKSKQAGKLFCKFDFFSPLSSNAILQQCA